ncbi:MAG: hypothetical protein ACYSW7_11935 [Planctomycetota bacterium]|jgi:hypothetical protein
MKKVLIFWLLLCGLAWADNDACSLITYLADSEGELLKGAQVTVTLHSSIDTLFAGDTLYIPSRIVAHTDSEGHLAVRAMPTALLDTNAFYRIEIVRGDDIRKRVFDVKVPDSSATGVSILTLLKSYMK